MSAGIPEIPQGLENQGPDDHQEYIPPATVTEDNSGAGEGFETSGNVGNGSDSTDTGTGYNPAWSPLLEKIPTPFHEEIRPFLSDWDKNFNKVQSQYAPYKTFVDNQVAPESIENSLKLAQLINANPRLVYEQLGERFGFASGQGQNEVEETNEEDNEFSDGDFTNPLENPALKPYIERQEQMIAWVEQQEAQKQEFAIQQEIQNEWSQIESTHGSPIPQNVKTEMIKRAIFIADAENREPNIIDGYNDYNRFVAQVRGQRANNTAPQVFSGNGGVPSTPTGITGDMTDEQRINYIAERAKSLNQNTNGY